MVRAVTHQEWVDLMENVFRIALAILKRIKVSADILISKPLLGTFSFSFFSFFSFFHFSFETYLYMVTIK